MLNTHSKKEMEEELTANEFLWIVNLEEQKNLGYHVDLVVVRVEKLVKLTQMLLLKKYSEN
jgi:hypothetical protein